MGAATCHHKEQIVRDIGICDTCTRVIQYNPYEEDRNAKPIILKEGHVPGIEYINQGTMVEIRYEGKLWATMSMANDELSYITQRIVQSMAKAYLREGSLSASRSIRDQVLAFLDRGMNDEQIIVEFAKDKRDTVRRYIRDLRKERTDAGANSGTKRHRELRRVHAGEV